jgi:hypothetical protein
MSLFGMDRTYAGERQRAVQRPARRFENKFGIHARALKVFRVKIPAFLCWLFPVKPLE